jgi:stringent starvation protein B
MNIADAIVKIDNLYAKKVFLAAYEYLTGLMEIDPSLKRIHIVAFTDATATKTITYSIGPAACGNLITGDDGLSFSARFAGIAKDIFIPWSHLCFVGSPEMKTPFSPNLHDPYGMQTPFFGVSLATGEQLEEDKSDAEKAAEAKRNKMRLV